MLSIEEKLGLVLLLLSSFLPISFAEDPWDFLVLADWHGGESFARNPGNNSIAYQKHIKTISYINQTYGGDLVLAPGDSNDGKWYRQTFIDNNFPGNTPQEAVYAAGISCYTTIRNLFAEGGYDKFIMTMGDHEIGDNGWGPEEIDPKTASLPQYRESFARGFNRDPDTDEFIYTKPIGTAPASPIGTEYQNISYAYQHKNVLFMTVDAFKRVENDSNRGVFSRSKGIGGEGVVTGTVTGDHLAWVKHVLQEANNDSSIKHIIVQTHLPIYQPVRKINSSAMFMDYAEHSEFWKAMVEHKVDLYFAGEVHANTVTKDPNSNLIQVVSRGNFFNNLMTVSVTDNSILVKSFNEVGDLPRGNNHDHTIHGRLEIIKDPSDPDNVSITSTGQLKIVDLNKPLIHFDFERLVDMKSRPVIGMKHDDYKTTLEQRKITIRDVVCRKSTPNSGSFSKEYDAQVGGIKLEEGKVGQYAGEFTSSSRFGVYSFGPFVAGHMISTAIWIKTTKSSEEMIVIHYGGAWSTASETDIYILTLDQGSPKLYLNKYNILVPRTTINLADGEWHHVAIIMPEKSCRISQLQFYVDGTLIETKVEGIDNRIFFLATGNVNLGGFGHSNKNYENRFPNMKPFIGLMDDFYLWGRSLEADEVYSTVGDLSVSPSFSPSIDPIQTCDEEEIPSAKFVLKLKKKNGIVTRAKTRNCRYLSKQKMSKILNLCLKNDWYGDIGPANVVCPCTCSLS